MKYILIFSLLFVGALSCLGQDFVTKSETASEPDAAIQIVGDEELFLVSSFKTARIITKDEFEKISLDQIDYIQVIKDPSSTIIYGDKARNGVVLVVMKGTFLSDRYTTKRRRNR